MKKVCFLVGNLNESGGTERVPTLIANKLVNIGYDVSILNLVDGKDPFFSLDSKVKNFSLYERKLSFKKNYLGAIYKIRNFVKEKRITHLIVVDSGNCLFTIPALAYLDIKHICWEHFNFKNNNGAKQRDWSRILAAKYCDFVITLTNRDKEFWYQGIKKVKAQIVTIPNPQPYEAVYSYPSKSNKVVLAVGRLLPVKGYNLLLSAWNQVVKNLPDWQLIIVGEGRERSNLTEFINENNLHNNVKLVGNTKNVTQYYEQASIYCLSSYYEGFPMVLLEAQAFGLPIVAFDCDTGPNDIVMQGINGLLVPPTDYQKLSESLIKLMSMPTENYNDMVIASKKVAQKFTIDNVIDAWVNILK